MLFLPSSVNESPLSLCRFKFMEKSIDSFSLFFSLFFFVVVDDDDDLAVVVVAVVEMLTVVAVVGFVMICFSVEAIVVVEDFMGVFFLFTSSYYLGPALFFVGVVPSFSFRAFVCCSYGFCSRCCCCCCCCCYSCRGRCCCCCCRRSCCFGGLLRAGF